MVIVDYTDIITLARAKNYLRIDDSLTEDDNDIVSMINAAFLYMERYTNHIFKPKDFTAYGLRGFINNYLINTWAGYKVYNYPINTFTPADSERFIQELYSVFRTNTDVNFIYNAGYINVEDVPNDFIQCALQMIKVFYYESEKQVNDKIIPVNVIQILDSYRRFV